MDNTEGGKQPKPKRYAFLQQWRTRFVDYVKRKLEKRRAKYETESPTERAERRTADATWFIGLLTFVIATVGFAQWWILSGTLDEVRNEQKPIIWVGANLGDPKFVVNQTSGTGQVIWTFHFTNDGKDFVASGSYRTFIKVGDGAFMQSYGQQGGSSLTPIAPNQDQFVTVISAPMTQDAFTTLSKTERAFSIQAEFIYFGLAGDRHESRVCLTKLLAGAIQFCAGGYVK